MHIYEAPADKVGTHTPTRPRPSYTLYTHITHYLSHDAKLPSLLRATGTGISYTPLQLSDVRLRYALRE